MHIVIKVITVRVHIFTQFVHLTLEELDMTLHSEEAL